MAFVTGALGNLVPKLLELLKDEYKLQKGVKEQVESLAQELKSMHTALCKVAEVPHDELDSQLKLWASEVREASYDMEDVIDTFLVRVDGGNQTAEEDDKTRVKRLLEKMGKLFNLSKIKARRDIAGTIKEITKRVEEMTKLRDRYKVDDRVANYSTPATRIDPRLLFLHTKASELVGIDEPRDALIKMLSQADDDTSDKNLKVVSIFGCGGLGKTTLAQAVYDKLITISMNVHCRAFVPVGQHPDLKKVFRDFLLELNKDYYLKNVNFNMLDERQLIGEIKDFLKKKRYLIVIDDIWEVSTWKAIRTALDDNNLGSKIIITTRSSDVANIKPVCFFQNFKPIYYSYKLMPLPQESSEKLFYGRIFGSKEECPERFSELSQRFLKKCGGVPLAIITLSSLLANKLEDITYWEELCKEVGSGLSNSDDGVCSMRKILSFSYYDLPSHLKTCFLYLSMFPEDYEIGRDQLIWMWIGEGFVQTRGNCDELFELGLTYFNELINRSLVQPVGEMDSFARIYGCRVHDMILDLICSLSREQNFATTSDQVISSETMKVHRLSLNNNTTWPKVEMSQVRSLAMLQHYVHSLPSLSSFGVLRVLVLKGSYLEASDVIQLNVGNLIHLRCLWLGYIPELNKPERYQLPEGIEKLKYLQILNMERYLPYFFKKDHIPSVQAIFMLKRQAIFMLKRLVCIEGIYCNPTPGNLLRNLESLEVLEYLCVSEDNADVVQELGHLTKLTKLRMNINITLDQNTVDALFSSLNKLRRLRELSFTYTHMPNSGDLMDWGKWTPPPHLRELMFNLFFQQFRTFPKWISPTSLDHLTELNIAADMMVRPEDIQILGELRSLSYLRLSASRDEVVGPLQKFKLSADAFPCVTHCYLYCIVTVPSMFPRGAMPRVKELSFYLRARDFFSDDGLGFSDLALDHFTPSLSMVYFNIRGSDSEEVEKVKEAAKHAGDAHPNRPWIEFW